MVYITVNSKLFLCYEIKTFSSFTGNGHSQHKSGSGNTKRQKVPSVVSLL